jgi:hypothetical protein
MDIVRNILIQNFALDITNIIIDELSVNIWKNRFNNVIHYIDHTMIYLTSKSSYRSEKTIEFKRNNRLITLKYSYLMQRDQQDKIIYKCIQSFSLKITPKSKRIDISEGIWRT